MTIEEKIISEKMGHRNPFSVPEGYFDQLAQRVADRLPEEHPAARTFRLRPLYYAAASVVALLVVGTVAYTRLADDEQQTLLSSVTETTTVADDYLDEAADYAMIDNHDIYLCLTTD